MQGVWSPHNGWEAQSYLVLSPTLISLFHFISYKTLVFLFYLYSKVIVILYYISLVSEFCSQSPSNFFSFLNLRSKSRSTLQKNWLLLDVDLLQKKQKKKKNRRKKLLFTVKSNLRILFIVNSNRPVTVHVKSNHPVTVLSPLKAQNSSILSSVQA